MELIWKKISIDPILNKNLSALGSWIRTSQTSQTSQNFAPDITQTRIRLTRRNLENPIDLTLKKITIDPILKTKL